MDFGITIKPDISIDRILRLTQQAESAGFSYAWMFDSHVIWKDPFPLLTLMASSTRTIRLGTCVTNPAVRDVTVSSSLFATLNLASHGRMELGDVTDGGIGDAGAEANGSRAGGHQREKWERIFPDNVGIEHPGVGEAGGFGLLRQTQDAVNGDVRFDGDAEVHGRRSL